MKKRILPAVCIVAALLAGCSKNNDISGPVEKAPEVTIVTPPGGFTVDQMKWVRIAPDVINDEKATFLWTIGADTLGTTKDLLHVFATEGQYTVKFTATNSAGEGHQEIVVNIAAKTYTNGVARVFDFLSAPGQFVNTMPAWKEGDNDSTMAAKAEAALKNNSMIHLGGFGGYIVMGFDHTIINTPGENSFLVKGNAFNNWSEPGIIMVSYDANGNGIPDDEWYEIAGSEYDNPKTVKNYQITYYKPDENKVPTPNDNYAYISDTTYIRWKDNQGKTGFISKNVFHSQSYYPQWKGDSITFTGTKLTEENVVDLSGNGSNYASPAFDFGYADNWSNNDDKAKIKISWAVDETGKQANLKGVDFIKVHTGMRAKGGWLGEISTEITGVTDLNLK
ncbi:PKD-like domain-containing protein [Chitinophaga sp. MM2321]|uniref:PKD-like domain-containing protein n=1 Tax=Chitinophaga sp. MM2321 TaxID=3137178 RepID=UPI0032D5863E